MDYSIYGLVNEYYNYKKENYENSSNSVILFSGLMILIILLSFAFWLFALYLLIKYWVFIPIWAQIIGIIGILPIFPIGPVLTVIVVLVGKQINK